MILAEISSISDAVSELFSDAGSFCVDMINSGLKIFAVIVSSAGAVMTKIIDSKDYTDVWGIINLVATITGMLASSLLIFTFLYKLFEESFDIKNNIDIWGMSKAIFKLVISVILVSNALKIVCVVINSGAYISGLLFKGSFYDSGGKEFLLDDSAVEFLKKSVTGIPGFFMVIISFICMVAMAACAVGIAVAIYKRLYTTFILIPFASFSLSFFNMPDFKGREIFSTYLKGIIKTAVECVIISMVLLLTYAMQNGNTMKTLFASDNMDLGFSEIVIENDDELAFTFLALHEPQIIKEMKNNPDYNKININNLSPDFLSGLSYNSDLSTAGDIEVFSMNFNRVIDIDGTDITGKTAFRNYMINKGIFGLIGKIDTSHVENGEGSISSSVNYPVKMTIYNDADFSDFLIIVLRVLFPCVLAAGIVLVAREISSLIIGGF